MGFVYILCSGRISEAWQGGGGSSGTKMRDINGQNKLVSRFIFSHFDTLVEKPAFDEIPFTLLSSFFAPDE